MDIDLRIRRFQKDLNGGLIALVLLAVLERAEEDLYPYEMARQLAVASADGSRFSPGSIYPVLRTLARDGLLTSRIVPSYSGPPRRYYRITAAGRLLLPRWRQAWQETCGFVDQFVVAPPRRATPGSKDRIA